MTFCKFNMVYAENLSCFGLSFSSAIPNTYQNLEEGGGTIIWLAAEARSWKKRCNAADRMCLGYLSNKNNT